MRVSRWRWACLLGASLALAQYPMPMPRIPFPPLPRRGGQPKQGPTSGKNSAKKQTTRYSGPVVKSGAQSVSIETEDKRVIDFQFSKETKFEREGKPVSRDLVKAGAEVSIDAWRDEDGFFHAVAIAVTKLTAAAPPAAAAPKADSAREDRESPATVTTPPPAAPDPDDPGPPVLRHGQPPARHAPTAAPAETTPPAPDPTVLRPLQKEDAFLDKVREVALEFTETLPNYLCKQMTTRYQSDGRPVQWRPLDIVSAAVVYEDGRESYRDVRINDKPTKKDMDSIPGSRSRGEYGATLRDLFSPGTAATFRFRHESTAAGRPAAVYDFQVEQPRSHWQNRVAGQMMYPAYKGSVWIDKASARVLRIEMQARSLPDEFPLDTSEWVVDYDYVRIGPNRYLVPVHAENLACFRGTLQCVRNATDFRNYRRFTSESQIMTIDSAITYDGEDNPPPAPPAKP